MAQTYDTRGARGGRPTERPAGEPSGWAVGWTVFAGTMLMLLGVWWAIAGIVGIANDAFFVTTQDWVFRFDTTAWGWIHLVVGVVLVAAGGALFTGAMWARVVGVIVAAAAMLIAFAWLPWYPIWALLFIAVSVAVIWALTAHGRDITLA